MTALQRLSSHLAARLLHNWTLPHACFDGNTPLPGLGGRPGAPLPALPEWKAQARRVGAWGAAAPTRAGETRSEAAPWRFGGGGAAGALTAGADFGDLISPSCRLAEGEGGDALGGVPPPRPWEQDSPVFCLDRMPPGFGSPCNLPPAPAVQLLPTHADVFSSVSWHVGSCFSWYGLVCQQARRASPHW